MPSKPRSWPRATAARPIPLETAAAAAQLYDFSAAYLDHYFDQLKYGFPGEYRRGLAEFYRRARAIGELDEAPSLELDEAPRAERGDRPSPADLGARPS